jgi:hypothetical protein
MTTTAEHWIESLRAIDRQLASLLSVMRDNGVIGRPTRVEWFGKKERCIEKAVVTGYHNPELLARWLARAGSIVASLSPSDVKSVRRVFEHRQGMFQGLMPTDETIAHKQ